RAPGRAVAWTLLDLPGLLAGGQLIAARHAILIDDVDMVADDHAGPDALGVAGMLPEAVLGDVARAAQLDGQGGTAEAGHAHRHAVAEERRGVHIAVEPLTAPQLLTGLRIKAAQEAGLVIG